MSISPVITSNLLVIQDGLKVLRNIRIEDYHYIDKPAFASSVGSHFRHVIEHYRCFLNASGGKAISYDERQRDVSLETDLGMAMSAFEKLETSFKEMDNSTIEQSYLLHDGISDKAVQTNAARELLFLQSHTTHHYAAISAMLKKLGIEIDKNFGVATATLVHERMHEKIAHEDKHLCAQ